MTLSEASEYLGKSEKTISRYIKRGILHPDKVKTQSGQLEYRFLTEELDALKDRTDKTGQKTRHQTQDQTSDSDFSSSGSGQKGGQTGQKDGQKTRQSGHMSGDERAFLYGQIEQKDRQIEHLSRQVSMYTFQNSQLQNKLLGLPAPKGEGMAEIIPAGAVGKRRILLLVCLAVTIALFVYVYRAQIIALLTNN